MHPRDGRVELKIEEANLGKDLLLQAILVS